MKELGIYCSFHWGIVRKAGRQRGAWAGIANMIKVQLIFSTWRNEGKATFKVLASSILLRMSVTSHYVIPQGKKPFHQRTRRAIAPFSILLMEKQQQNPENPSLTSVGQKLLSFFFRTNVTRHSGVNDKYHSVLSISASIKGKVKQTKTRN